METNAQKAFRLYGQSIWLDTIGRDLVRSGRLAKLRDEGVRGATSNPSIFHKAISGEDHYDAQIRALVAEGRSAEELYLALVTEDIGAACEVLRPLYEASEGGDGFVSLELPPRLASDTAGSVEEALRLSRHVDRPNLLVKIPGTEEGFPAVEEAIFQGVSINITLLFSLEQYRRTAEAYLRGLERRLEAGLSLEGIASVASFFVSRVDTACDRLLEAEMNSRVGGGAEEIRALLGRTGIANSKMAYRIFRKLLESERWSRLARSGARPQRLLWASTSTKDPTYPDTMYVDRLIGAHTVNTVPLATWKAFQEHGRPAATLDEGLEEVEEHLERLAKLGIDLDAVCRKLLDDGVAAFAASMDALLELLDRKRLELGARS